MPLVPSPQVGERGLLQEAPQAPSGPWAAPPFPRDQLRQGGEKAAVLTEPGY